MTPNGFPGVGSCEVRGVTIHVVPPNFGNAVDLFRQLGFELVMFRDLEDWRKVQYLQCQPEGLGVILYETEPSVISHYPMTDNSIMLTVDDPKQVALAIEKWAAQRLKACHLQFPQDNDTLARVSVPGILGAMAITLVKRTVVT